MTQISYELATWKIVTVQLNYHIAVDKMNYPVPCEYIKRKIDARITRNVIDVFFKNYRICSQFAPAGWHVKIGEVTLADTILDRIGYNSCTTDIHNNENEPSMREVYGIKE